MEEKIKKVLIGLQSNRLDFKVIFSDEKAKISKSGQIKLGDYIDSTRTIRIFVTRHNSVNQILDTVIHEYVHHLMNERFIFKEQKRVVHGKKFRECYHLLIEKAKMQGVFNNAECQEDVRIKAILERWYIRDTLLMMTCLSHELTPSLKVQTMRCGEGRIEYNPQFCAFLSEQQLEEILKAEVVRILLLHPYRLSDGHNRQNAYIASNITLNEYYDFKNLMFHSTDYWEDTEQYRKQHFEFYYAELQQLPMQPSPEHHCGIVAEQSLGEDEMPAETDPQSLAIADSSDSRQNDEETEEPTSPEHHCGIVAEQSLSEDEMHAETDPQSPEIAGDSDFCQNDEETEEPSANPAEIAKNATELWGEDEYIEQQIKEIIEWATNSNTWGTLSGELQQTLIANLKPEIDYRKVLSGFRSSILSSKQTLTRFHPSRRYGFEYMGKKPKFTTKLLIGVDVSGSISDHDLKKFYAAINRFFKYGIECIEVQQFDCELKGEPIPMKKAKKEIKIFGRGGTCFQPVIDCFASNKKQYDGLIIFTDGYAEVPEIKPHIARKTLWICNNKDNFERHKTWMLERGRACWIKYN